MHLVDLTRDAPVPIACAARPGEAFVVLADPAGFDVRYAINEHMRDASGALNQVDRPKARAQWEALRAAYTRLGCELGVIEPHPDLPDLCFTANQSLPVPLAGGSTRIVLSRMATAQRQPEVAVVGDWFRRRGYEVVTPAYREGARFEGMGDALWHPGRLLLWGGLGPRSNRAAYEAVAAVLPEVDAPLVLLQLVDDRFYHLDTALALLSETTALYVAEAFDAPSRARIRRAFPQALAVPISEAHEALAANAHCPDGAHVLIDAAARQTRALLEEHGFAVIPLDTSEFRKSGGSVFCLKLAVPSPPPHPAA